MVNIVNFINIKMVLLKSCGGHDCPEWGSKSEFNAVFEHFQTAYLLIIAIRSGRSWFTAVYITIYIDRTHMCTNKILVCLYEWRLLYSLCHIKPYRRCKVTVSVRVSTSTITVLLWKYKKFVLKYVSAVVWKDSVSLVFKISFLNWI